jgi:uncharacterized protein (TIGR02231 family)
MRHTLLLPALTLSLAAQAPTLLNAPIQKVRVHPDEAWVTRSAKVKLSSGGIHKLQFAQLPGELTLDDLRIEAKGPEGTRIGEILVGPDRRIVAETAESRALLAKLEVLQQRKTGLEAQQNAAHKAQEFLDQFQSGLRADGTRPLPSASQLLELNRGMEGRLAELSIQSEKRGRELEDIQKQMKELESRWQTLQGQRDANPNPCQITVELSTPHEGDVEVELSYRTPKARWKPSYEAHLSPDGKKLDVALYAAVTQTSGESWDKVDIELCNSLPSRVQEVPRFASFPNLGWKAPGLQLPSSRLDGSAVVEVVSSTLLPDRSDRKTATSYSTESLMSFPQGPSHYTPPPPKPVRALEAAASILEEAKGLARTWKLQGQKSVPSDGDAHRFQVLNETVEPTLHLVIAPRLNPTPIQMVRFDVPSSLPLFPGAPVLRTMGNLRLGQGTLQIPAADQRFELSFGEFQGVRASLNKILERTPFRMKRLVSVQQTQGRQVRQMMKEEVLANDPNPRWELQEQIHLANDTSEDLTVEVIDRAIKSQHESVSIQPLPDATPPTHEASPGVNAWLVHLPSKGKAQVNLGWSIRAPKEGEVMGLRELGFN